MPIGVEDVRHIALLARLDLNPQEEEEFAAQLDNILRHFGKLQQLDTEQVEPLAHVGDVGTVFRDDVVANQPAVEELLANAPARDQTFFKVPKIIE